MKRAKEEIHKAPTQFTVDAIRQAFESNDYSGMSYYQKNLMNSNHTKCRFKMESKYTYKDMAGANSVIQTTSCGTSVRQSAVKHP